MSSSLEAKIVVLGSQGVGKTSLVNRYVKNAFEPAKTTSTVGASFVTKRVLDTTSDTVVRLQIWDTAGQERFRSISRLYYRGANACLLCYDITDERSFEEMTGWLQELKQNLGHSNDLFPNRGGINTEGAAGGGGGSGAVESPLVIHVVGTKADIVTHEPWRRKVPFERTIAYTAEQLYPSRASTPPPSAGYGNIVVTTPMSGLQSPDSKRSSGFWGQDYGWDCCHEISAKDGEGVEEVFRVIARKLVEQRNKQQMTMMAATSAGASAGACATSKSNSSVAKNGSSLFNPQDAETDTGRFVLGLGREYSFRGRSRSDKRRNWLGFESRIGGSEVIEVPSGTDERRQSCC